ncbi:DUF2339 domain-containing protein [Vibrio europaeus]|uniref:DUF2339 domain-containing protein n=1 Tax=Vibrio europaeus TaxID=300876 RepID=UPI0039E06394
MELLILIGLLAIVSAVVTPILAIKANDKANRLEHHIRLLKQEIDKLKLAQQPTKQESLQTAPATLSLPQIEPVTSKPLVVEPATEPKPIQAAEERIATHASKPVNFALPEPEPNTIQQWFDKCFDHMRDNWLVWIGGLAMVIGAGYLVQVVGSNFTFPPIARVLAATATSLIFIAIGEWAHREISNISKTFLSDKADAYIPAALYASGMSGLYATVIFSTVIYQFFTPTIALMSMASLALMCLALTARLGPLMAVLGLFGGYSAPFWIGGNEPNYLLLTSYILTISLAGALTMFYSQIKWLATAISISHGLWLLLIGTNIPSEQILPWFLLFVPISTYLLVLTPIMGWQLKLRFKPIATWPLFHPLIPAAFLAGVSTLVMIRGLSLSNEHLLVFIYPALLLIIPAVRGKFSSRTFYGVTILAMLQTAIFAIYFANEALSGIVWVVFAALVTIASIRTQAQYLLGDRHIIAYWMASLSLPTLIIGPLIYINQDFDAYLSGWTVFGIASLAVSLFMANTYKQLVMENTIAVHVFMLAISYCYLETELLPLTMAIQVLIASLQNQYKLCSPGTPTIKIMMALLIGKMSLVPFVPQLQINWLPEWAWLLTSFVPAIAILIIARQIIGKIDLEFREWFDAATLHLFVLLTFNQTNYWLIGSYNFFADVSFYSVALFTCQALALFAVYQMKHKTASHLSQFYHYYSLTLLGIAALLFATLNTVYQPLTNTYVTGEDWPLINWLAIGWVVPAFILAITAQKGLFFSPVKIVHLFSSAACITGLWVFYSIRQFWQDGSMTLTQPAGMAEMLSYSLALILIGAGTTYLGVLKSQTLIQKVGLATLGVAVCKVFLLDTATLEGIWRAISFLGLGGSLIGLGWLFQRLHYHSKTRMESNHDDALAD